MQSLLFIFCVSYFYTEYIFFFIATAKPEKPKNITVEVKMIAGERNVPSAVVSIDWNLPVENNTDIVRYNLTLLKMNLNIVDTAYVSLHNTSYTEVVREGKYQVSLSAVDLCGQESEPSMYEFEVNTSSLATACQSQMQAITTLSIFLAMTFIGATTIIVLELFCFCYYVRRKQYYSALLQASTSKEVTIFCTKPNYGSVSGQTPWYF